MSQQLEATPEQDAWDEYLCATEHLNPGPGYTEVEQWAWARLQQKLEKIERKAKAA